MVSTLNHGPCVRRALHLLGVALMLLVPADSFAQTLRGVVSERVTYEPIDGGTVLLLSESSDTLARTLTDERGYFSFQLADAGDYYLLVSALGYRSVRSDRVAVDDEEVRVVELDMAPRPIPVEGLIVETEGEEPEVPGLVGTGFYDRMGEGWGEFLAPGQVLAHPGEYTPQLFREMTRVDLLPVREGPSGPWNDRVMIRRNVGGRTQEARLCEPYIYIDGVLRELMPGEALHDAVRRDSIEAIEVHPAPFGAPLRFIRDYDPANECGVILIWTKRD